MNATYKLSIEKHEAIMTKKQHEEQIAWVKEHNVVEMYKRLDEVDEDKRRERELFAILYGQ